MCFTRENIEIERSCFPPKLSTHLDNPGRQGWMHYRLAFCATDSCFDLGFLGNSTVLFRGWKCTTCVVGAKAAVHHFAWLDATGRLFGLCEVLLSYIDGREVEVGGLTLSDHSVAYIIPNDYVAFVGRIMLCEKTSRYVSIRNLCIHSTHGRSFPRLTWGGGCIT